MRIHSKGLATFLFCVWQCRSALSFAPQGRATRQGQLLFAEPSLFSTLPVPPPPPPPPLSVDTDNLIDSLVQQASKALEGLQHSSLDLGDLSSIQEQVLALKQQLLDANADPQLLREIGTLANNFQANLVQDYPQLRPFLDTLTAQLQPLLQNPTISLLVGAVLTYGVANFIVTAGQAPPPTQPYPNQRYDPVAANLYFSTRLFKVLSRSLYIVVQSAQFGLALLGDKLEYVPVVFYDSCKPVSKQPLIFFNPLFTATRLPKTNCNEAAN